MAAVRLALALLVACAAGVGAWGTSPAHAALPAPHAGGDSAANIPLASASERVLTRWVARQTGRLRSLHFQIKVEGSSCRGGRSGYASGNSGLLRATTHPVLPDGRPDQSVTLASDQFVPCARWDGGSARIAMDLDVVEGQEYATVVRNVDPSPTWNWFSTNHLAHWPTTLWGAQSRNERSHTAGDVFYGLDPRELVGYSTDGGATWSLPGGPYGGLGGRIFIPTYIQEFADGSTLGQPYYYSLPAWGTVRMVYPSVPVPWTIRQLGAYTSGPGGATVTLWVDGQQRGQAFLAGQGMLRADIAPVDVAPGSTVVVSTTAGGGGLALHVQKPDARWAAIAGLGTGHAFYLESSPREAVPVYPLPMYGTTVWAPPDGPEHGAPAPPYGGDPPFTAETAPPAGAPTPVAAPREGARSRRQRLGLSPATRPSARRGTTPGRRPPPRPTAVASSSLDRGHTAARAIDGRTETAWASLPRSDQFITIDRRSRSRFTTVEILWGTPPAEFTVATGNRRSATKVRRRPAGRSTRQRVDLAGRTDRFVRIAGPSRRGLSIREVRFLNLPLSRGLRVVGSSNPGRARLARDGRRSTAWRAGGRGRQFLGLRAPRPAISSGLRVRWASPVGPHVLETSRDGRRFVVRARRSGARGIQEITMAPRRVRAVRVRALGNDPRTRLAVAEIDWLR